MTDGTPANRGSAGLERGEVPEVVALGNALTTLFNTLGVSQSAYAVRVSLDKSAVSRALRGRRVATQDFIDRLVREVESTRGAPVQPEVRSNLRQLRLNALHVCDPAAYELESLRGEMERTQRKVEVLVRHQEALHDLLEKKEQQVEQLRAELHQVRQDWIADQAVATDAEVAVQTEPVADEHDLAEEVARLQAELADVAAARAEAEARCAELESRVREMEEEVAARSGEAGSVMLPLGIVQDQLTAHWESGRTIEAARDLTEAALTRQVDELSDLVNWLDERGTRTHADHVVREVARIRGVEDVAAFGRRTLDLQWRPSSAHRAAERAGLLAAEACLVMTPQDIAALHLLWPNQWDPGPDRVLLLRGQGPHSILAALLESPRGLDDIAQVMAHLPVDDEAAVRNLRSAAALGDEHKLALLPLAKEFEWRELFSLLFIDFSKDVKADHIWLALGTTRLSRMTDQQWRALTGTLLENLSLVHFSRVFCGACEVYKDFLTPEGLRHTFLAVMLQELDDRGLLRDFSKIAGSRPALLPKRRKERALARGALIAWHRSRS
ncbi:hypothetical protein ACFYZB_05450 [Streptomyces sp. NPDC001852]|uniref:hypothetical protein n=1 Tax=Streptomyces sp. NPDC001852 TaxID=3364619 RepID=UPI0036CCBECD